jgi:hypothetical protein
VLADSDGLVKLDVSGKRFAGEQLMQKGRGKSMCMLTFLIRK